MRILVTGSREVPDAAWRMIRDALLEAVAGAAGPHVLVHGGARGADRIAANVAANLGWRTEPHEATWMAPCRETCTHPPRLPGERCVAQGNYRNAFMVGLGADVCVAFFLRGAKNRGTRDCANQAHGAGIRVKPVKVPRDPAAMVSAAGEQLALGEVAS
jgi:YspA, cpYpsA-related SLOG family